jgi:NAD(P)-dependent dehydrogenase (short-subunit alcohol dehydrogenase family)
VTGAGSGIGRGVCLDFAREGITKFLLADLNENGLKETKDQLLKINTEVEAAIAVVNTAIEGDVDRMVSLAVSKFGRIDHCCNAAGITSPKRCESGEMELETFQKVIDVNLTGVWLCQRRELQQLVKQDANPDGSRGTIVNVGSIHSHVVLPGIPNYVAAKFGVIGMTMTDAVSYASRGIRLNAVCPGLIETPMTTFSAERVKLFNDTILKKLPLPRWGKPEDVAHTVSFLSSDKSSYIVGQNIIVDGGYVLQ